MVSYTGAYTELKRQIHKFIIIGLLFKEFR